MNRPTHAISTIVACALITAASFAAHAQTPVAAPDVAAAPPAAPTTSAASTTLAALAWLRGCWAGKVDVYDFIEQWLPPRAGMMVGVSHTLVQDRKQPSGVRTEDYEYLRLEARADGVYYIASPSRKDEVGFKLTGTASDQGDTTFTFSNPSEGFPQRIVYRHTKAGSLYAEVGGKVDGRDKAVTYPMHPVDCVTGKPARE
jgi:hypothetical protein